MIVAIVAIDLESPSAAVSIPNCWDKPEDLDDLPNLQHASDVMWYSWWKDNPNIKRLCVFGAYLVKNKETSALVARALRNKKVEQLSRWPGTSFSKDEDENEWKALIGQYPHRISLLFD